MKKITFILFALITGTTFAQFKSTANSDVNVHIVSPISIVKGEKELSFGNIAAMKNETGEVTIDTEGGRTDNQEGAMLVMSDVGSHATFEIIADADYAFNVNVSSTKLSGENAPDMDLILEHSLNEEGNKMEGGTLQVGGTLKVGANQPSGEYTGEITVTIAYQ